jgi:hypothetical protein
MPLSADVTFDVAVDAELHRALPQTFGTPPEDEGETAGALFFGEAADEDPAVVFINIPGPPGPVGDSFDLILGDDPDTANTGPWTSGAVALDPLDSVGIAISLLNKKLALAATEAELQALAAEIANFSQFGVDILLGDEIGTDDVSIWNGGAITLTPSMTVGEAIGKLNHFLSGGLGAQDGFHLPLGDVTANGDGSWLPGAVALSNNLPVSEAVDRLNEVLSKLLPAQPSDFPNGTLTVTNTAGSSPRLASGVTDNSGNLRDRRRCGRHPDRQRAPPVEPLQRCRTRRHRHAHGLAERRGRRSAHAHRHRRQWGLLGSRDLRPEGFPGLGSGLLEVDRRATGEPARGQRRREQGEHHPYRRRHDGRCLFRPRRHDHRARDQRRRARRGHGRQLRLFVQHSPLRDRRAASRRPLDRQPLRRDLLRRRGPAGDLGHQRDHLGEHAGLRRARDHHPDPAPDHDRHRDQPADHQRRRQCPRFGRHPGDRQERQRRLRARRPSRPRPCS